MYMAVTVPLEPKCSVSKSVKGLAVTCDGSESTKLHTLTLVSARRSINCNNYLSTTDDRALAFDPIQNLEKTRCLPFSRHCPAIILEVTWRSRENISDNFPCSDR
jgi:hypothetical protein